ncbi:glycogenin-1-like isoform X2 [Rana temporaria]|uniref:glycogenin-1-like isoform X2 n=1 Tax=Rana temporaria TaxID=8407 RepID=UPI001AAD3578|nr:glycogenin-1-like isoform X2 [Rana temporaria]
MGPCTEPRPLVKSGHTPPPQSPIIAAPPTTSLDVTGARRSRRAAPHTRADRGLPAPRNTLKNLTIDSKPRLTQHPCRMPVTAQAFVTLGTNDLYCQGALVLGKSLRNHKTSHQLVVIVTSEVTGRMRGILREVFDEVVEVDVLDSADSVRLSLLKRPELGVTFTKIRCWTLTQYTKCVFMDADTIALCNIDELFDREEFSAAPDSGWPDCFNSGVFVFRPSLETFGRLLKYAEDHGSFDGGDQGLLNSFFGNWATADISKHLPFIYNLSISSIYTYSPAFKQFGSEAKVVHFIGTPKPWNCKYNPQTKGIVEEEPLSGNQTLPLLVLWWQTYISDVLPLLTEQQVPNGSENKVGRIEFQIKNDPSIDSVEEVPAGNPDSTDHLVQSASELSLREAEEKLQRAEERREWEEGHMDYMGRHSFESIQKKLDQFLQ